LFGSLSLTAASFGFHRAFAIAAVMHIVVLLPMVVVLSPVSPPPTKQTIVTPVVMAQASTVAAADQVIAEQDDVAPQGLISPGQIVQSRLRAVEQDHQKQLTALNAALSAQKNQAKAQQQELAKAQQKLQKTQKTYQKEKAEREASQQALQNKERLLAKTKAQLTEQKQVAKQQSSQQEKLAKQALDQQKQALIQAAEQEKQQWQADQDAEVIEAYKQQLKRHISPFWHIPTDVSDQDETAVEVTIDEQGSVTQVIVTKPSGHSRLDYSIQSALQRASPLPLPATKRIRQLARQIEIRFAPRDKITA